MKTLPVESRLPSHSQKKRPALLIALGSSLLFLAIGAFGFVLPPAITVTVNSTGDTSDVRFGDGLCADSNGNCTLRAAIQEATAYLSRSANTIQFNIPTSDPHYNASTGSWTIALSTALPDITSSANINGPGPSKLTARIGSPNAGRVFNVTTAQTVSISGLTIANGSLSGGQAGAGLQNVNGSTINISNCVFLSNVSSGDSGTASYSAGGGAIYNASSGTINVATSTFDSNRASSTQNNGEGGAIWNISGTISISNSTFLRNSSTAYPGYGGAIASEGGTVTVTGSTFYQNSSNFGGAIYLNASTTITNSTFYGNVAAGIAGAKGGAIYNYGNLNLSNSTITANIAMESGSGVTSQSTTRVKSAIIAGNLGVVAPDVSGAFISAGFNLIGKKDGSTGFTTATDKKGTIQSPLNPMLDWKGLRSNGGPTQTITLLTGSPAIDAGTSVGLTGTLTTDQRGSGHPRIIDNAGVPNAAGGDGADIGAFEVQ